MESGVGYASQAFWYRCIQVNDKIIGDRKGVWLQQFRPSSVGDVYRDAARRITELPTQGVDPVVIDHVNRVKRALDLVGSIVERRGSESLNRDVASVARVAAKYGPRMVRYLTGLPVPEIPLPTDPTLGGVTPGVVLGDPCPPMGPSGSQSGTAEIWAIFMPLVKSEEETIRHVRQTYGVELPPW
jgi:hypothetical protein